MCLRQRPNSFKLNSSSLFPHTPPFYFSPSYKFLFTESWFVFISNHLLFTSKSLLTSVFFCIVKGTVSVISSYYQCKDGNTVPLKVHNFGATKSFMYTTTVQLKLSSPSQGLLYCQQLRHKKNLNRRNLVAKYCRNLLVLVDQD